ncbi:ankyrin repeat domain-containing protein [uncultured Caulobacter sp.]|uniref:ankyrin repeat domain-containing protein n=1 Tax=uncultured Caulobacter sp. TaxID=158749 RepID=UPI002608ABD5|nr:ankyrin repeat domain-containing protein [uncultured Caulobacter sp.]
MSRALTPKTHIETLRKDAKRWLKALRAGDPDARARLTAAWPKAPAEPALRDVQHALALEYGRDSWIALKAALDDLAIERQTRAQRIEQILRHGWDGDPAIARRILARHPDLARDSLFTAAACGDRETVERHLARDPEAVRRVDPVRGWTALAHVAYGRLDDTHGPEIARLLLEAGADPNFGFTDDWETPFKVLTGPIGLGEGAKPSHPRAEAMVALLVAHGADAYDSQALYNVSIVGHDTHWYDVLWRQAEAAGALDAWRVRGPNRLGYHLGCSTLNYLLGNAVGQNHVDRARWLLERGADANTPHAYEKRPVLAVARLSGFTALAELLEAHGAAPVAFDGAEALQALAARGDASGARALVAARPEVVRSPQPLLSAAMHGNARAVALLLSLGADAMAADHEGITALHRAVQSGSLEAVEHLLAAGADVDVRERRWRGTPLSWAVVLNQRHLAERLAPISRDLRALASQARLERLAQVLDAEPDLIREVMPGDAPTVLFCLPDDEDDAIAVARLLLSRGADRQVRNDEGDTAATAALKRGLDAAAEVLS